MFAQWAHEGQLHRDNMPAFAHAERVAAAVQTPQEKAVAYLHDVIEDTRVTPYILSRFFDADIVVPVLNLTRFPGESWRSYMHRVKSDQTSMIVKIADIEDNIRRADDKFRPKIPMYVLELSILKSLTGFSIIHELEH
jgi:(p)ppGpp synthase/HD superfamily hydrolase